MFLLPLSLSAPLFKVSYDITPAAFRNLECLDNHTTPEPARNMTGRVISGYGDLQLLRQSKLTTFSSLLHLILMQSLYPFSNKSPDYEGGYTHGF